MGAVNVTVAPAMRLLAASRTVTTSGDAKAVPTWADCPPPALAVIEAGAPALLVSVKLAAVATPVAVAVTA